jgi:AraC family transcriptional regulator
MKPRIENISEKKLVGKRIILSLSDNRTGELWKSFMPRRKEIQGNIGKDLFSMQLYDPLYFTAFHPDKTFEKWAAIEVSDFDNVPDEMESYVLPGGLYAVFHYKGSNKDTSIFEYIFTSWLPGSGYSLDNRPHFEVLGEKYKNEDPDSEEDIWIPIQSK